MLAYTDPQWRKFWDTVGKPELSNDPRFLNLATRSQNIADLYRIAGESLQDKTTDEWLEIFEKLDIPCARIATLEEVFNDPHLSAVGMFARTAHPTEGDIVMTQLPFRFSDTKVATKRLQPKFGEHSREILAEVGYSDREVNSMLESGSAIAGASAPKQSKS
jgi:crotonobetainyl-CoA:carnitine CoA-transferase CaiB-like acyl-CoA transferase